MANLVMVVVMHLKLLKLLTSYKALVLCAFSVDPSFPWL